MQRTSRNDAAPTSCEGVRVVLVEGHDDSRDLWAMALTFAGFVVRSFGHPADALANITQAHPQVVITSIALPDMSGDDFARAVRAARLPSRPLLVAVTSFSPALREEEAGLFDLVLLKPVQGDWLVAKLRELIGNLPSD